MGLEQGRRELKGGPPGLGAQPGWAPLPAALHTSCVTVAPHRAFLGLSFPICQIGLVALPSRIL